MSRIKIEIEKRLALDFDGDACDVRDRERVRRGEILTLPQAVARAREGGEVWQNGGDRAVQLAYNEDEDALYIHNVDFGTDCYVRRLRRGEYLFKAWHDAHRDVQGE